MSIDVKKIVANLKFEQKDAIYCQKRWDEITHELEASGLIDNHTGMSQLGKYLISLIIKRDLDIYNIKKYIYEHFGENI
jgi:hypothetical protein